MILTGAILLGLPVSWLAMAAGAAHRLRIGFRQALLYVPLKLAYRIDDRAMRDAGSASDSVIYVVWHQSHLDPALMLSLLPEQTLHILDEGSAKSLIGLVAPVVLGVLGRERRSRNLDTDGLISTLQSQKSAIANAMPSGLARALGSTGLLDGFDDVTQTVTGGNSSITAMRGSTEEAQFKAR